MTGKTTELGKGKRQSGKMIKRDRNKFKKNRAYLIKNGFKMLGKANKKYNANALQNRGL